jgi:cytochrome c-type biogenesis protein CcmH/NrfG
MSTTDAAGIAKPTAAVYWRPIKIAALLAVIVSIVYVNSLAAPFLFDDLLFIGQDGQIRQAWDWDSWRCLNRGFATWSLQWNYEVGRGFYPWQYRLTNVVIHIAAGLTLFGLVRRTLMLGGTDDLSGSTLAARHGTDRADWFAAVVAILWLVHPLQTQAVTYVVQRYESLMALFFLLTLYFTVRGAQSAKPRDWYIAAWVSCMLGALSKEVIAVCPLVLLLYDRAFLSVSWRQVWQKRWPLYAALALPVAFLLVITRQSLAGEPNGAAGFGMKDVTAWEYLSSQPAVILHYLRLAFWPNKLILDYGWPVANSPLEIYGLGAVILMLVGLSLWAMCKRPKLGFLGLAFFLILAPTSSILPIKDLAFEHRMYLPLAAVVILTLFAVEQLLRLIRLPESVHGHATIVLVALAAGGLSFRTMLRNRDYSDSIAIWRQCIANNPSHPRPYRILADVYAKESPQVSIQFYQEGLAKNPDWAWMWIDLGNVHVKRHNFAAAAEAYERAAQVQPRLIEPHLNLSRLRMKLGDWRGALAAAEQAVALKPKDAKGLKQLAWLLTTSADDGVRDGKRALAILATIPQRADRVDIQYLEVLSAAHAEAKQFDEAVTIAERALAEARKIKSRRIDEFAERVELYRSRQPMRMKVDNSAQPGPLAGAFQ